MRVLLPLAAALFIAAAPGAAQMTGAPAAGYKREAGLPSSSLPAPLREIGFDQNLDRQIPLDIPFHDDQGRLVTLGSFFGTKPVVLAFAYYECPMLCTLVLNALASSLDVMSLEPGKDFEIVTISFDPRETPALAHGGSIGTRTRRPLPLDPTISSNSTAKRAGAGIHAV